MNNETDLEWQNFPSLGDNYEWLDVPYDDKEEAKRLGAGYDGGKRQWYGLKPLSPELEKWRAINLPSVIPGEDREYGKGLFIDLVPNTCWFTNVRSCVSKKTWESLRRMVRIRADSMCEICGNGQAQLEVHERWIYDYETKTQKLVRLICLCRMCHMCTHMGYAFVSGNYPIAIEHFMKVNKMSLQKAEDSVESARIKWERRSSYVWTLDLSILEGIGIEIKKPSSAKIRAIESRIIMEGKINNDT